MASRIQTLNLKLQQGYNWKWTPEWIKAFKASKDLKLSAKVPSHYDPVLPLKLTADPHRMAWKWFSHIFPDGLEHPIALVCRKHISSECNYAQIGRRHWVLYLRCSISTSTFLVVSLHL